jgi:hypothetical protein
MGEDHEADSMTEIYAQNDRICTAELEILMEPAAVHNGGAVRVSSHEPATLRDHIAISDYAVQQVRPEFVRTRAGALEACGFAECSPACARILAACH